MIKNTIFKPLTKEILMKLLAMLIGLCLIGPYSFSAQLAYDTGQEGVNSYLIAENHTTPAMVPATSYTKTINNGRYIGGGIASIFLGFGIGHAIQGRWGERGWIFTLGDAIVVGGIVTSTLLTVQNLNAVNIPTGYLVSVGGFALLGFALRIWSILDAWSLPAHYKIVQESRFQVSPLVASNYSNFNTIGLGLNVKYRF